MFTSMDKALVALLMGIISIINLQFGWNLGFDANFVSTLVAALTPFIVYWIPNKVV